MHRLTKITSVIILILALAISSCSSPAPAVGKVAPDFQLQNLDGQAVSLSDFRGRPVLLNFWASWCEPCRFEMPFIQKVFEDEVWSEKGLVILGVDIGESPTTVEEFVEAFGLTFPMLLDINQDVALKYNIRGIPTTFLIDKDGIIQNIKVGPFSSKVEIEREVSKFILR